MWPAAVYTKVTSANACVEIGCGLGACGVEGLDGALLLTGEEVGADATGDVGDEACGVRPVVGSVALQAARIKAAESTHSDFMQPVFALTSIAGRLSSGQMKGVPNARDQLGDRG